MASALQCRPGDTLALIIDGFIEVFDRHDRELGLKAIKDTLSSTIRARFSCGSFLPCLQRFTDSEYRNLSPRCASSRTNGPAVPADSRPRHYGLDAGNR